MTLYTDADALGLVIGNHESDLYLVDTPEARKLCKAHGWSFSSFVDARTGDRALDAPFAYAPWWEARAK